MNSIIGRVHSQQPSVFIWLRSLSQFGLQAALVLLLCTNAVAIEPPEPAINPELQAHQDRWVPARIEHVAGPVHMATGYSLSNMVFIEGQESVIVIDWGGYNETTAEALADYRAINDKPIKTLLLTHPHQDHFGGVGGLFPDGIPKDVAVIGPENDYIEADKNQDLAPHFIGVMYRGALLQMGFGLPQGAEGTVGAGAGPMLRPGPGSGMPAFTHTLTGNETITVDGIKMELVYTPADLEASYSVWLPDYKVLITGDLPSLAFFSTPRNELTRDINNIVNSTKLLTSYPSEHLLYLHSPLIYRGAAGKQFLLDAHDYLKLVRDQTDRAINNNQTLDDLIANFPMPEKFLNNPEMKDHYHRFTWMVRGLYMKKVGWFGGDMAEIVKPLAREEALRMATLAGGEKALWKSAQQAYEQGDFGWAVQQASYLLYLQPENKNYKQLKAYALRSIAFASHSTNERHFLLTDALVLEGKIEPTNKRLMSSFVSPDVVALPIASVLDSHLGPRLRAEDCLNLEKSISVEIVDRKELHTVSIRNGVALYKAGESKNAVATARLNSTDFYNIFLSKLSWKEAMERGLVELSGDEKSFFSFVDLFEW